MPTVKVATVHDVLPGTGKAVQAGSTTLAVFNLHGTFYAIENTCTHAGGPLGEGRVEGTIVVCPWHGSRFDVTTGSVVGPPARRPVRSYVVTIVGDDVLSPWVSRHRGELEARRHAHGTLRCET